jgi:hypothetical protein
MELNKGAIGPSGESLTCFKEVNKVSVNLRAFRGHSCFSVTSNELHREGIVEKGIHIFRKKIGNNYALLIHLRSFPDDPINNKWNAFAIKLNQTWQNVLKPG